MHRKHLHHFLLPLVVGHFTLNNFRESVLISYPPDLDANILEIVQMYVGVCEIHEVETQDGYFLKMFRIPRTNPKGVVLLQHPILCDARAWISQYNESTAYIFWRAGYDVWLGNSRGTLFGRKHRNLQTADRAFWNFSFHEMGYYDNLAITEYIKEKVNHSKIIYVGYSMGATSGLVYASTRSKEAADSIKLMVIVAPAAYIKNTSSILRYIVPILFRLRNLFDFVDIEFPVSKLDVEYLGLYKLAIAARMCIIYLNALLSGGTPDRVDPNLVDMSTWKVGSETSLKVIEHFVQIHMCAGRFQMYDNGPEKNLISYGATKPPLYALENIKVPIFHIYGQYDGFISVEDNEKLYDTLPKSSTAGKLMIEGFNHGDFFPTTKSNEIVYRKIIQILEEI